MKRMPILLAFLPIALAGAAGAQSTQEAVDFNRDIRPILAENCFQCHGPDRNQRKADLRLDTQEGAFADRGGYFALVAGKPDESELYARITSDDQEMRMPPPDSGHRLTERQIALVTRWIEEGANWKRHWSYLKPTRPLVPPVADPAPVANDIDHFILAKLDELGLRPALPADRLTLVRRLSLDLTGLPPPPEEVEAFAVDPAPDAYEKLVDRLLASPHYGERMAVYWLDLVRYADTDGYHGDNHRDIALYRDWVIRAFNDNKPFDRFTIEQLAGDLVPNATRETRIASGYNRLLMTTREGGAQAREYLAKYAADRVRNASTVWLAGTLGCAECHDHKFDPFTTGDFYRFAAFFADVKETAVGEQEPVALPDQDELAELARLDDLLAEFGQRLETPTPELAAAQARWEERLLAQLAAGQAAWLAVKPEKQVSEAGATLEVQEDLSVLATGENPANDNYIVTLATDLARVTGIRLEVLAHPSLADGGFSRANGNFVLTGFQIEATSADQVEPLGVPIAAAAADYSQEGFPVAAALDGKADTGWAVAGHEKKSPSRQAVFSFAQPLAGGPGTTLVVRIEHQSQYAQHNIGRWRLSLTTADKPALPQGGLPGEVLGALAVGALARSAQEHEAISKYYRSIAPELDLVRAQAAALEKAKEEKVKAWPTTLVSMPVEPRVMRILPRGNWLDESGEIVTPAAPAFLPPLAVQDRRPTRLDLAEWLVGPDNPQVARVFVNRLWKLVFGQGIVKSLDDFGSQGSWPTHPDLLDWLAVELVASGWDTKHMLKLMVMSGTYRQSSAADAELGSLDPYNKWLARQGRFRLDSEMVRDQALAASGLLVRRIGGASVKPYQPAGYWAHLNFPTREYQNDEGENLYRRGLYTYWCRTFLHPSLLAFDASTREECMVDRPRSNTPLQALVLLNDPTYVEAARVFAERILREGGATVDERIHFAFRHALSRPARPAELALLASLYQEHRQEYQADTAAAGQLVQVGGWPVPKDIEAAELAAWTSVARVILNLHETITRY